MDYEKGKIEFKFGDLVRVKSINEERYVYAIYINENEEYYKVTDSKDIFKWNKINSLERIGSALDENLISLLRGE